MSNMRDFGHTYRFGSGHGEKKKLKKIYKYFQPIRMRYAICLHMYVCVIRGLLVLRAILTYYTNPYASV